MAAHAPALADSPPPSPPTDAPPLVQPLPSARIACVVAALAALAAVCAADVPALFATSFAVTLAVLGWIGSAGRPAPIRFVSAAAALGAVPIFALLSVAAFNQPVWGSPYFCGTAASQAFIERAVVASLLLLVSCLLSARFFTSLCARRLPIAQQFARGLRAAALLGVTLLSAWQLHQLVRAPASRSAALTTAPVIASLPGRPPHLSRARHSDDSWTELAGTRIQLYRHCEAAECFAYLERIDPSQRPAPPASTPEPAEDPDLGPDLRADRDADIAAAVASFRAENQARQRGLLAASDATPAVPAEQTWILRHHPDPDLLVLQAGQRVLAVYHADSLEPVQLLWPSTLAIPLKPPPQALWCALFALLGGAALSLRARRHRLLLKTVLAARQGQLDPSGWISFDDDTPPIRAILRASPGPVLVTPASASSAYRGPHRDRPITLLPGTHSQWRTRLSRRITRHDLEALAWTAIFATPLLGVTLLSLLG